MVVLDTTTLSLMEWQENPLLSNLLQRLDQTKKEFDEVAAVQFQTLRKKHRRLGTNDLKIAAIAMSNNATLITDNTQDFSQIEGLKFEDWTKART